MYMSDISAVSVGWVSPPSKLAKLLGASASVGDTRSRRPLLAEMQSFFGKQLGHRARPAAPSPPSQEQIEARKTVMARETAMLRRQATALSKAPLLRDVIPESDTSNVSLAAAWRGVATELVAPPWDPQLRVPATALDAAPPPDGVLQLPSGGPRSPLLPSLFMPGFPKAATTFLYECLLANFGPTQVGCGSSADGWDARSCGRRFALTTLNSDTYGRIGQWKETFFFGGKAEDKSELGGRDDLLGLHGPDPRRGALASLPALWAWDSRMRARDALGRFRTLCEDSPALPLACAATAANGNRSVALPEEGAPAAIDCGRPRCSVLGVAACEGNNFPYNRGGCSGQGTPRQQPVSKCTHPACIGSSRTRGRGRGSTLRAASGSAASSPRCTATGGGTPPEPSTRRCQGLIEASDQPTYL